MLSLRIGGEGGGRVEAENMRAKNYSFTSYILELFEQFIYTCISFGIKKKSIKG